jgi:hypothetical protein
MALAAQVLDSRDQIASLRALLEQRFPNTRHFDKPEYGALSTGIDALDALLPGGVPRGAITLLSGEPSCGKTGIALAVAAELTRQGGQLAWGHDGTLSSAAAAQARVDLGRLLQVRVSSASQALRCADFLLRWNAFHLVVLDWPQRGGRGTDWNRVHRLVTGSNNALLVLGADPREGAPVRYCASLHLRIEQQPAAQGTTTSVQVAKSRYGTVGASARLERRRMPGEPFQLLPDLPGLGQGWHEEI